MSIDLMPGFGAFTQGSSPVTSPRGQVLLVVEGDSIPSGYGTTGADNINKASYVGLTMVAYPGRIGYGNGNGTNQIGNNFSQNQALSGTDFATVVSRAATTDGYLSDAKARNAVTKILVVHSGVNGPGNSVNSDPVALLADYASYASARRTAGWKTLFCTILPATSIDETDRGTVNAGLRTMLANGDIDALADFDTQAIMGNLANVTNLTYYQADELHPTDAGHALLRTVFEAALFPLIPARTANTPYTTWDSSWKHADITLSGSDRVATNGTSFKSVRSSTWYDTGKVYAEIKATVSIDCMLGLLDARPTNTDYLAQTKRGLGCWLTNTVFAEGFTAVNAPTVTGGSTGGTVIRMAIDFDAGKLWVTRDADAFPGSGDPVAGTNPSYTFDANARLHLGFSGNNAAAVGTLPAGSGDLSYSAPSGYSVW
jgi:hypothetical protein